MQNSTGRLFSSLFLASFLLSGVSGQGLAVGGKGSHPFEGRFRLVHLQPLASNPPKSLKPSSLQENPGGLQRACFEADGKAKAGAKMRIPRKLCIETSTLHLGLKKGEVYALAGELPQGLTGKEDVLELPQLLIFLGGKDRGEVRPVWLIGGKNKRAPRFDGVRFLRMHDPAQDRVIF